MDPLRNLLLSSAPAWLLDADKEGGGGGGGEGDPPPAVGTEGWYSGIEHEGIRGVASQFPTEAEFQKALGYEETPGGGAAIPAGYRDSVGNIADEKVREFASRHDSLESLARTGLDLRQKLSSSHARPGENATPEEIQAWRTKALGVPETWEGYEIKDPEKMPAALKPDEAGGRPILSAYLQKMHSIGAPPAVAQESYNFLADLLVTGEEELAKQDKAFAEKGIAELQKTWGSDFETNVDLSRRTTQRLANMAGIPESEAAFMMENARLDGMPLGSHPVFNRMMAALGGRMQESGGEMLVGLTEDQTKSAQAQIEELTAEGMKALKAGDKAKANQAFEKRDKVAGSLYGHGPLVGTEGRAL